jgi:hypothetical protein
MSLLRQHVAGAQAANALWTGINDAAAAPNQMCGASNPASGNFHCPDLGGSRLTDSTALHRTTLDGRHPPIRFSRFRIFVF